MMVKIKFTKNEAYAVAKIIAKIILANGLIDIEENAYYESVLKKIGLTREEETVFLNLPDAEAYESIKKMDDAKRSFIMQILNKSITVDGSVDKAELDVLNEIADGTELFRSRKQPVKDPGTF